MKSDNVKSPFTSIWSFLILLLIITSISGCSDIFYVSQVAAGNFRIMSARTPIESKLKEKDLDNVSRNKLKMILEVRAYASEQLGMPKNKSYTVYSEINGQCLGWNVFVAPRFSIEPIQWCFPLVGCVVYRGYFSKREALKFAQKMKEQNYDVFVAPFDGYSTLGWYDDPVTSSQLRLKTICLVSLVIHELAHQKIYVPGDCGFNEAFAVTVERAGTMRWLNSKEKGDLIIEAQRMWDEEDRMMAIILKSRAELIELYNNGSDLKTMTEKKNLIFANLKSDLYGKRDNTPQLDEEMCELNNAYLVTISTYYSLLPIFQSILDSVGGDFPQFYEKINNLGKLPFEKRQHEIELLKTKTSINQTTGTPILPCY